MPIGVPGATVTAPVEVLSVIPAGYIPIGVIVALPLGPSTTGFPLILSFVVTFVIAVPPFVDIVPFSVTAFTE